MSNGLKAVEMSRWRTLALLLFGAVCWVAAMPAFAKADPYLTILDSAGEPATQANFAATYFQAGSQWNCEEFELRTTVTENEANPVLLDLDEGRLDGCYYEAWKTPIEYDEFEFTDPMSLNADGSGEIPIRVVEDSWFGKCIRTGTLDLSRQESGGFSFEGVMNGTTGGGWCLNPTVIWSGSFAPPTDYEGEPMEWIVTP